MTIVNSWNEWDPLKHVIVGTVEHSNIPPMEPALEPKISKDSGMAGSHGPRPSEAIEKANIQLDNFVKILESHNINVDRPTPIDFTKAIQTPDWSNDGQFGSMPPRDVILTVGNEMLEAPMSYRCRWFEYLAYRPLLEKYYDDDPNMRWESAPKPRLTSVTYKSNYLPEGITDEERYKKIEDSNSNENYEYSFYKLGGELPCRYTCGSSSTTNKKDDVPSYDVNIYPNPTSSNLNVEIPMNSEVTKCEIYDSKGDFVSSSFVNGGLNTVDVSLLANGTYVCKIYNEEQFVHSDVFIKQ